MSRDSLPDSPEVGEPASPGMAFGAPAVSSAAIVELGARIGLIEQAPCSAAGFTITRPADYEAITVRLRKLLHAERALLRRGHKRPAAELLECIARLERTPVRTYPTEALRLALVKAELLLECGEPVRAIGCIEHVALRPYLVEGDLGLQRDVLALHHRALLADGRRQEAARAAWRDLALISRLRPRDAAVAYCAFKPVLHLAPPENIGRLTTTVLFRLARLSVSLERESGRRLARQLRYACRAAIDRIGGAVAWASALVPPRPATGERIEVAGQRGEGALVTRAMGGAGDLIMMTPGLRALARMTRRPVHLAIDRALFAIFAGNDDVILHDINAETVDPLRFRRWHNLSFCPAGAYESRRRPNVLKGRVELFANGMGISDRALADAGLRPRVHLSDESVSAASEFFIRHGLPGGASVIGVQMFSRDTYKDYPRMSALLERLAERYQVVVLHHRACSIPAHPRIVPAFGQPLGTALAVLARCDLAVCVDSAFLHMAAALDMPTVALFGPTDSRTFTRHHSSVTVVSLPGAFKCMPCWRNEDMPCQLTGGRESACLAAIDERAVLNAVEARLGPKADINPAAAFDALHGRLPLPAERLP